MKLAVLYAGQGAQHPGMGKEFYESSPAFRAAFDSAALDFDLHRVCFEDPDGVLNQTEYTQPCMVAFACGVTAVLAEQDVQPAYAAGLSLGEYSALEAAGVFTAKQAIELAAYRGKAMADAAKGDGYSIVKPEIKNKVEIPEMLPHKCATEVLAETEKFVEPIDNYSAGKRILAGEQEGAQIVYFKLAKAEIDSNYLDNERVLEHIIDVIRRISEDPEVEIARVVLLGLSSPEGAFEFNKQLSGKRAEALKQYIADRIALADSCFALVNGDEGWEELRYKVEHSDMEYRKEVLNIIDSVPIMKGREGQLQRLKRGVPYRYLEEHFFPQLRRAGYIKVYYRMKNGTV